LTGLEPVPFLDVSGLQSLEKHLETLLANHLFDVLFEDAARAVLGHTALEATATGTVEQRPASSLVLFDKDGKVIWKVP
jgi:hypothetical protein